MKKATVFLLLLALACTLTACSCKHEWQDATCETPKNCILCEETQGEPLGHSWQEATCEEPKTCSRCGSSEGEALGHSWADATCKAPKSCSVCGATEGEPSDHRYSTWEIGEEIMTRSCADCGTEESQSTDWNVFLQDLLGDRWICTEVESLNGPLDMYVYFPQTPFLEITEDRSIRFFNGTENNYGTAEYVHRMEKDGIRSDVFKVLEDGTPRLIFSHRVPVEAAESVEQIYANPGLGTFRFERETEEDARARQELVGSWTSVEKAYSGDSGYVEEPNNSYSITFRDDYGFTANVDGEQVEGVWSKEFLQEDERITRYVYRLKYVRDNRWVHISASICHFHDGSSPSTYSINFENEYTVYYTPEQST